MTRCLMVLSVVTLVLAGAASADVKQGDTELDFMGGFMTQNGAEGGADFDSWFLSGAFGYFISDNIQLQAAAAGFWTSVDTDGGDVDLDFYALGGRAKYHFMPSNQWVPYLGVQVFYGKAEVDLGDLDVDLAGLDDSIDGTLWGPLAGIRYALNENNDFYAEYQYQIWGGDIGDILDDGHLIVVGIIHQFK